MTYRYTVTVECKYRNALPSALTNLVNALRGGQTIEEACRRVGDMGDYYQLTVEEHEHGDVLHQGRD
jgi:hypothetical protein